VGGITARAPGAGGLRWGRQRLRGPAPAAARVRRPPPDRLRAVERRRQPRRGQL